MILDQDLQSIQEVRNAVAEAKTAQLALREYDQKQIDALVKAIADVCVEHSESLAKMAASETGFGIWQDKVIKNLLGSKIVYEYIRDLKTIGIISEDREKKIIDVAVPVGIVAALIPSTNPTSTTMFKALISIKAGNAILFSPHPNALQCIQETVKIMNQAAAAMGAPKNLMQCISIPTMEATSELMKHPDIGMILATGGSAMVKAAYSSGTPALGVGPGNGPAYIESSADIPKAIRQILDSKTFDNGTICASEQSIVTESRIKDQVMTELIRQGGYLLNKEESERLSKILMRPNNTMNPAIVGKSVEFIGSMAGISAPKGTRVLVAEETKVGHNVPFSREKLCPVLAFYTEEDWEAACQRCIDILENEGAGHTMTIHSSNEDIIREFALKKPISRLLVNTPAALGGVGATTNLVPSLTLGCGSVGGSSTSDNVGPLNLINIRRVAYGVRELTDLRDSQLDGERAESKQRFFQEISPEEIESITREVLKKILKQS